MPKPKYYGTWKATTHNLSNALIIYMLFMERKKGDNLRYTNEGGGVNQPLGLERKSNKEFCQAVHFSLRVLDIKKGRR